MAHVAYIDSDEEIISVIGRLRKVGDSDVFFVIPKRALFLQSLVNLRLLERESKKLKKHLVLVSQDEAACALAIKAGLSVKSSLEGVESAGSRLTQTVLPARLSPSDSRAPIEEKRNPEFLVRSEITPLHSESIGSSSFFEMKKTSESSQEIPAQSSQVEGSSWREKIPAASSSAPRSIPVRDRNPRRLTMLNSVRAASSPGLSNDAAQSSSSNISLGNTPASNKDLSLNVPQKTLEPERANSPAPSKKNAENSGISFVFPAPVAPAVSAVVSPRPSSGASPSQSSAKTFPETPIARLYQSQLGSDASKKSETVSVVGAPPRQRKLLLRILFGFGGVSICAALGVAAFIFLPRADVVVLVKKHSESIDAEVLARVGQEALSLEEKTIPLRLLETEKDIVRSFPGTGQSTVSDKRAHGMVTLSNAFGSAPQSLVATTRLESPDGKIFRLTKGVTIPGTKEADGKTVPGTVIVEVVADEAGDSYNINPGTFSIPGFRGGPKYASITAFSEKAFAGGGTDSASQESVSADDVAKAKELTERELASLLRIELEKDLRPGERLLDDAFQWEILSFGAFPGIGAVASSFDYRIRVSARALIFSESDAQQVARSFFGDGYEESHMSNVEYTIPRPDFFAKTLLIKARVSASKEQKFDVESFKKDILGKQVSDVQKIFSEYPDVQKVEVVFRPKFLTNRIPNRSSQVEVSVETEP